MAAELFEEIGTTLHAAGDEQRAHATWKHALELLDRMNHAGTVAGARRLEALISRSDAP